jgi:hypothetical protein
MSPNCYYMYKIMLHVDRRYYRVGAALLYRLPKNDSYYLDTDLTNGCPFKPYFTVPEVSDVQ